MAKISNKIKINIKLKFSLLDALKIRLSGVFKNALNEENSYGWFMKEKKMCPNCKSDEFTSCSLIISFADYRGTGLKAYICDICGVVFSFKEYINGK